MDKDVKKPENTSLHPAGPGNWSFRSLTECSDCGATLGLDGHPTVGCCWAWTDEGS